jgi:hypothetical protein
VRGSALRVGWTSRQQGVEREAMDCFRLGRESRRGGPELKGAASCGHAAQRAWEGGPDTGGDNPRTAASGRARGRQGKTEKGESKGIDEWASPEGGARCRERRWEGEREADGRHRLGVGPAGRERREKKLTRGPVGLNKFDLFQTHSNLIWSKQDLPVLQKFEIKYVFGGFDERNNFLHMNFSRFEMDFELKFREFL